MSYDLTAIVDYLALRYRDTNIDVLLQNKATIYQDYLWDVISRYESRLYTPINAARGFEVTSLVAEIEGSGNPQEAITPNLNQRLITSLGLINAIKT